MASRNCLPVICTLLLIPALVRAQDVTFTRITTGGIVTTPATYWGGSWGDYDDDGWLDLFVGSNFASTTNYLYHNDHDGTFTLIDSAAMPKSPSNQHGSAWADYDNDGHLDLIVSAGNPQVAHNMLYHNNGDGTFSWTTTNAIYDDFHYSNAGVHAPRWGDYNSDGLIDLFIAGHDIRNRLFRNEGGGSFTRITDHVLVNDAADSEGGAWVDYDDDGDLDLFVANAFGYRNALYRNDESGVFSKVTTSGLSERVEDSIGSCWADYDNDGFLDLFLANFERNTLYHNDGNGTFSEVVGSATVSDSIPADWLHGTCAWGDYDNDGFLDLIVTSASFVGDPGGAILGKVFLYHNAGDGTFTTVTEGSVVNDPIAAFASWVDYDNDGFLDLFLAQGAFDPVPHTNLLYHNDGNANSWLTVKLVGTVSNRSGIGAKVRVNAFYRSESRWQVREISGGDSQENQQSLNAEFGLGDAAIIDTLRIEWPSGTLQELHGVAPRQFLTVIEPGLCRRGFQDNCRPAGRSRLFIRDSANDAKDRLAWRWLKGAATTVAEFGLPMASTTYALCIYDATSTTAIAEADIAPSATLWRPKGTAGFRYTDRGLGSGGIGELILKAGAAGKAKAVVRGQGVSLSDPSGPLTLPVSVQLVNSADEACFEGIYDGAAVKKNDAEGFEARASP